MKLLNKTLKTITVEDILEIDNQPENFESLQIEYMIKFDGNTSELRNDFIQFANSHQDGILIFGIQDDPKRIIGIEKNEVDGIKKVLNNVLKKMVSPILSPFPEYRAIRINEEKYVFLINIKAKEIGIYAIQGNDNPNHKDYYKYQFWIQLDGNKHRMNIHELVELIEQKKNEL
ncbi:MAG: ATP-binding protein [Candidatus Lokiarchaeota archaeon]|nr:ATP-binding protein [Candidatus Harpocratesius repetitus]